MQSKKLITIFLLVFVAASVLTLAVKEVCAPADASAALDGLPSPPEDGVIVYYFHRTGRCTACNEVEQYTGEALQQYFPEAVKAGRLVWVPLNVELPEHDHFRTQYGLTAQHVIVARYDGGQEVDFKDLDQIWELRPEKDQYFEYIRSEVAPWMEAE